MGRFPIKLAAAAICSALMPLNAYAGAATATLAVSASVASNCTITTAPVAFNAYDPIVTNATTALTGTGSITIACTKASVPALTLGLGANSSGSVRRMANGAERLPYELYQPLTPVAGAACGALTQVWGHHGLSHPDDRCRPQQGRTDV